MINEQIFIMARRISLEEAAEKFVKNSIRANPERIHGIVRTYFQGRQSIGWAVGLLKTEDEKLVDWAANPYKEIYPEKYTQLIFLIKQAE